MALTHSRGKVLSRRVLVIGKLILKRTNRFCGRELS